MRNKCAHASVIAMDMRFEKFGKDTALGFGLGRKVAGSVFLVVFLVGDGGATTHTGFELAADRFFFGFESFGEGGEEGIHGGIEGDVVQGGENEEYDHEDHLWPCFTNGEKTNQAKF